MLPHLNFVMLLITLGIISVRGLYTIPKASINLPIRFTRQSPEQPKVRAYSVFPSSVITDMLKRLPKANQSKRATAPQSVTLNNPISAGQSSSFQERPSHRIGVLKESLMSNAAVDQSGKQSKYEAPSSQLQYRLFDVSEVATLAIETSGKLQKSATQEKPGVQPGANLLGTPRSSNAQDESLVAKKIAPRKFSHVLAPYDPVTGEEVKTIKGLIRTDSSILRTSSDLAKSINRRDNAQDSDNQDDLHSEFSEMPDHVPYDAYENVDPEGTEITRNIYIREDVINKCNQYRKMFGIQELIINEKLNYYAQGRANEMAVAKSSNCKPSTDSKYGENVFCGIPCQFIGELAVDLWAYDVRLLNSEETEESLRKNVDASALFQLFWKRSAELGVGAAKDNEGKMYIVVNFNPPICKPEDDSYKYLDNLPVVSSYLISWGYFMRNKIDALQGLEKVLPPEKNNGKLSVVPGWETEINKNKLPLFAEAGL